MNELPDKVSEAQKDACTTPDGACTVGQVEALINGVKQCVNGK